jgi:hypothetical protein
MCNHVHSNYDHGRTTMKATKTLLLVGLVTLFTRPAFAQQCFPEIQCKVTTSVKQPIVLNAACTGAGAPAACCTGVGTGTCPASGTIALKVDRACGTFLNVASTGAVSTAALAFPRPDTNNDGCVAAICNTGSNTITIKHNSGNTACTASGAPFACCTGAGTGTCVCSTLGNSCFLTVGGADVALAANECIGVLSTGANKSPLDTTNAGGVWYETWVTGGTIGADS